MNDKPKGKSETKKLTNLFVWLAVLAIVVAAFRLTWLAGRRSLITDLGMDGFRVTFDAALYPGEGLCIVEVWRDGRWTNVER